MLIRIRRSKEPHKPMPTVTRVDLTQQVIPSLSQTIQQPALAREKATEIAGSILEKRQGSIKQQLDFLRSTRASRGGLGAELEVPVHLRGDGIVVDGKVEIYDPQGYRVGKSRADGDV